MSGPRRLLEGGTSFERELLASARLDVGSESRLRRTLVAMGAGAAASGAARGAAGALGAGGAGTVATLKWLAIAVVVAGGASGAIAWSGARRAPTRAATPVAPSIASAAIAPVSPPGEPRRSSALGEDAPLVRVPAAPPPPMHRLATAGRPRPAESTPAAPAPAVDATLVAEIAALERARAAVRRRDAAAALRELDAYDRAFPSGALADEATVLRVDALSEGGSRAAAAALGWHFLATNPQSPHAAHVRSMIGEGANP
jgi:hypothetical protein